MRIALCTNYISPYRLPVYRTLSKLPGNELTIYTTASQGHDREWDRYDLDGTIRVKQSWTVTYLPRQRMQARAGDHASFAEHTQRAFPIGLLRDLIADKPDVIITGELGARTMIAKLAGAILRVPVIPWAYPSSVSLRMNPVRAWLRRAILRSSPAIIGMGKTARESLISQGAREHQIFDAYNAADLHSILNQRVGADFEGESADIKAKLTTKKNIALVVGRLVQMKAPEVIIDAWSALPSHVRDTWELVFLGDGPMGDQLRAKATPGVTFVGNVKPEEVSLYFEAADLHIFASLGDPWGLVVNESMHHAVPTLCSIHAGCCDDLIIEAETGFRFDPTAPTEKITKRFLETLIHRDLRSIGRAARIHASKFTPTNMAIGMQNAVRYSIALKRGATVQEAI